MPKVAPNTRRRGQQKGQLATLAAQHDVSEAWLRLIAFGTLDDAAFVQAIRDAAKSPPLWELVAPAALEALVIPTAKMERLGGSLDELLAGLLEQIKALRNRPPGTALAHVNRLLDLHLEFRAEADAARGRRSLESTDAARTSKTEKADDRAGRWLAEVEARRPGAPKTATYALIGRREGLTPDAIKKAIDAFLDRQTRAAKARKK